MPSIEDALREFFVLRPEGVVSAYLFGSHALGRAHRDSDVDVAVLFDRAALPTAAARFERRVRLIGDLSTVGEGRPVDVVVLNDVPPTLARRVLASGCRVASFDADADHAFLRTTLSRAADLEPFLRRTRRVKLAALVR